MSTNRFANHDLGRGQSPGKSRAPTRVKSGGGRRARGGSTGQSRDRAVWGETPRHALDQEGLTILFHEQKRFKTALLKQARLAKLDVAEVRSTEAERLRRINSQLAAGIADPQKAEAAFRVRKSDVQIRSEDMLKRQGKRTLDLRDPEVRAPVIREPINRRRTNQAVEGKPFTHPHEELTILRGPLLRSFSRARFRGYTGPPSRWLKGQVAAREIRKLSQKGLLSTFWTGELTLFERHSPLHWAVNSCSAIKPGGPRRGFHGEVLHRKGTDSVTLVRQARSVPRLSRQHWPRASRGLAWPTFPTLFESWEQVMRGKSPQTCDRYDPKILSERRLPLRRVLPGVAERIIPLHVRGIRADLPVPREFLAYFKYRWGFLILRRNRPLPGTLARWLAKVWKTDITRMFLVYPIRYSEALRRIPDNKYYLLSGFRAQSHQPVPHGERCWWSRSGRRERRRKLHEVLTSCRDTSSESDRGVRLS